MPRGKRLTPDEIAEIRRLRREGDHINVIEQKTGISHTKIVEHTKDIKPVFWSSKNVTSPATNTEAPAIPRVSSPQNRDNMTPPSETGYYIIPNQEQYPSQRISVTSSSMNYGKKQYPQQRKQKEQHRYQEGYDIRSNQDQYQSQKPPMDSPSMTYDQNLWYQDMYQRVEGVQRDIEKLRHDREEWRAPGKRISEVQTKADEPQNSQWKQAIEQSRKQQDDAKVRELKRMFEQLEQGQKRVEEYTKESQAWREKSSTTPVQPETIQPSSMTPAPPTGPENNTMALKAIPIKEIPTQTSAENKPNPVYKPSIAPQGSRPLDLEGVSTGDAPRNHLDLPKRMPPPETTPSDDSESRKNTIDIRDIITGVGRGLIEFYKKTNKTKKNTKILSVIPILESVSSENNKTLNKNASKKETNSEEL